MRDRADRILGLLLGTAVGDALGLPREGMSGRRARRLFGEPLRHHFLFGRGMTSDDTEHACLVAQALLRQPDDAARFVRSLAWGLRWWLLGLPAGVGRATAQATLKLWLGVSPERSGVWSAGNGPLMRAPLLGVCLGNDPERLTAYVRASTRLTHTDPRAECTAMLVAMAAYHGGVAGPDGLDPPGYLDRARAIAGGDEKLLRLLDQIESAWTARVSVGAFAERLGLKKGVSGYVYHTAPVCLYVWLRSPGDFREAVEDVVRLGGDADTTGAIIGALVGATAGASSIPAKWVKGLWEWPRSVGWMRRLAARLAERFPESGPGAEVGPLPLFWPGMLPRNLLFLGVVLTHGLRRLVPPY